MAVPIALYIACLGARGASAANLTGSVPATNESLWRSGNNTFRLTFDGAVAAPGAGQVEIRQLLAGGTFGSDLSASFTFTVESGTVLRIRETGTALLNHTWYAIRNVGAWADASPFEVHYVKQIGDASNDGMVLNADSSLVNAGVPNLSAPDSDRRDVTGDGRVLAVDVSATNAQVPSFPVSKPTGHLSAAMSSREGGEVANVATASATFTPVGPTSVFAGVDVSFDLTVSVGALASFDAADVVLGCTAAPFGFTYDAGWTSAVALVTAPTAPVGVYANELFVGGFNTTAIGTSMLVGRVTVQTQGLAPGVYAVLVSPADESAVFGTSVSALTVLGDGEPLSGTGVFTILAGRRYVQRDATGENNGMSWADAYTTLQDALVEAASSGGSITEIWVAAGMYRPDQGAQQTPSDRTATFQLLNGVALYGGFLGGDRRCVGGSVPGTACTTDVDCSGGICAGNETLLSERDPTTHFSILSGDLLANDGPNFASYDDNSVHIVTGSGTDTTAVLDGFIIEHGNADGASFPDDRGAGLYINTGSPTVRQCVFREHTSSFIAAALEVDEGSPPISDCRFEGNRATFGGAVLLWSSTSTLSRCEFVDNLATDQGGAYHNDEFSNVLLEDCCFIGNEALNDGGAALGLRSTARFERCLFQDNRATTSGAPVGGAILNFQAVLMEYIDCSFVGNSAVLHGGAVWNEDGTTSRFENCTFVDNSAAGGNGGAIMSLTSSPTTIVESRFFGNSARFGGAVYLATSSGSLVNAVFDGNTAANDGGAMMLVDTAQATVTNSRFFGNIARGMAIGGQPPYGGGAVELQNPGTSVEIANCTIVNNHANGLGGSDGGGGVFALSSAVATVVNSILWKNTTATPDDLEFQQIATRGGGSAAVSYSVVEGFDLLGGTGNTGSDPMLRSIVSGDLRLSPGSSAIDAASNLEVPTDASDLDGDADVAERAPLDLVGGRRFVDDPATADGGEPDLPTYPAIVDMGAIEYFPDCNNNGITDECDLDCNALLPLPCPAGCGTAPDCDADSTPDGCNLADCGGTPDCDDCNVNRVLDSCDIALGSSQDVDVPLGVPDECVTAGLGVNWSDPIWNLAATDPYPDNLNPDAVPGLHVTIPMAVNLFLDVTVEINSLRLRNGGTLRITQSGAGDLSIADPGSLVTEGTIEVANDRAINVGGAFTVGAGGRYQAATGAGSDGCAGGAVCAALSAASVRVDGGDSASCTPGGELHVTGAMSLASAGNLVIAGSSAPTCGAPFGSVADSLGITPPPKFTVRNLADVAAYSSLVIIGAVDTLVDSTVPLVLAGDFDNRCQSPSSFDWSQATVYLAGPTPQRFEVAGLDLGDMSGAYSTDVDTLFDAAQHSNFSIGRLVVGGAAVVTFANDFGNSIGAGACAEAQYVHTLEIESGGTVILENVRLYYQDIVGDPEAIQSLGCAAAAPACQALPPIAETILNAAGAAVASVKNRFLSFSAGEPGLLRAVRVKFVSLPGAFNVLNGTTSWVGLPAPASELPGKAFADAIGAEATFNVARLVAAPVFAEWSTFGVVHVYDEWIIPSRKVGADPLEPAVYDIQFVTDGCDVNAETSFSPPLSVTNARWGDVASLQAGQFRAPDGSVDVTADVLAVLAKFTNAAGAPNKARAEMVGTGAGGPQAALTGKIDISDVLAVLGAFSGGSYPFSAP